MTNPSPAAMRAAKAIYMRSEFDSNDIATIIDREFGPAVEALRLVQSCFARMQKSDETIDTFHMGDDQHEAWNATIAALAQLEAK